MADDLIVDVQKRFPSGVVVSAAFQASMQPGTITVLFGPSGAGKTTLVRSVAGLERPERGTIRFGNETWLDTSKAIFIAPQQRHTGYVFQEAALFPHLTVNANVDYGLGALAPEVRQRRLDELIARFDLANLAGRYPRELSGGQAQRVAVARALAPAPRLLLLDEPFASVDAPTRTGLRRLLRASLQQQGIAAVFVTHDRSEAIALGDQIAVLAEGAVRQVGPVLDVFRRPADLAVARSVGVESVLPAQVEGVENGLIELRVGTQKLRAVEVDLDTRDVFACIRAEDVMLERTASAGVSPSTRIGTSARNHFQGRIASLESEGPLERVMVDCGFPLAALITRHAREELSLEEGMPVTVAIKATAVHLVPRA
jgi:molybdate transport system ATP-binding protein